LNTHYRLKADLKQLKKTKVVMYIIASKLNSTFGIICSATASKMTAKGVEKVGPFALARRII